MMDVYFLIIKIQLLTVKNFCDIVITGFADLIQLAGVKQLKREECIENFLSKSECL